MKWLAKCLLACALVLLLAPGSMVAFAQEASPVPSNSASVQAVPLNFRWFINFVYFVYATVGHAFLQEEDDAWQDYEDEPLLAEEQDVVDALYAACSDEDTIFFTRQNGHVRTLSIHLVDAEAGWQLPEEVLTLPDLVSIGIYGLENAKPLPDKLFALEGLQQLVLSNYTWPLPEDISGLSNLEELFFRECAFKELPESIGKLSSLRSLSIQNSRLTALPEALGNLQKLEILIIWEAPLERLPNSLTNLSSLRALYVTQGKLTSLPENMGNLQRLREAGFSDNAIRAIPPSIANCTALEKLGLGHNALNVQAFATIATMPGLKALNLYNNNLTGPLPEMLFAMPTLEYLNLSENDFSGSVPASLMDSPSLTALILTANKGLKGHMLPFISSKPMDALAIYETSLEYAPEDAALLAAREKNRYELWEEEKRENPLVGASFSFAPDTITLFCVQDGESATLNSNINTIPLWGEDIQFLLSIFMPYGVIPDAEVAKARVAEVQQSIEKAMQGLSKIPKKELLQKVIEFYWKDIETCSVYGRMEDMGAVPIRTMADVVNFLQIESVILWVTEPEIESGIKINVCMKQEEYLMDGFPICVVVEDGVITSGEI